MTMRSTPASHPPRRTGAPRRGCLSCGVELNSNGKRYCSVTCRQTLRRRLNSRTGLLKALNTRYATFYFDDAAIIMDLLLYAGEELYSFIAPRSPEHNPAQDFTRMADRLGNVWWAEKRRSNRRYRASELVLNRAGRSPQPPAATRPLNFKRPARIGKPLVYLKLSPEDLDSPRLEERIKQAFRRQAMRHHPDKGGESAYFREIHRAYEQLVDWARNPRFVRRRGFPDKWFYNGDTNCWVQPTPEWAVP